MPRGVDPSGMICGTCRSSLTSGDRQGRRRFTGALKSRNRGRAYRGMIEWEATDNGATVRVLAEGVTENFDAEATATVNVECNCINGECRFITGVLQGRGAGAHNTGDPTIQSGQDLLNVVALLVGFASGDHATVVGDAFFNHFHIFPNDQPPDLQNGEAPENVEDRVKSITKFFSFGWRCRGTC